jgi:hypothetical protein
MSFRAKREIFRLPRIKKIRFLPVIEMADLLGTTFYGFIEASGLEFFQLPLSFLRQGRIRGEFRRP